MPFGFLQDLVTVLAAGIAVVLLSSRFRIPPIVGFLLSGTLVGPHGFGLVHDRLSVELLAEVGVVVLLFTIGVEFSLGALVKSWRALLLGGGLQTGLTCAAAAALALAFGQGGGTALLIGFVVALSSTALVLRLLSERAETSSPHGRVSLLILVFQDLAVVPMMLVVPFLASGAGTGAAVLATLVKSLAVVLGVLAIARKLVPPLLHLVVGTRSGELFLLTILVLCLGTAWLTSLAGLSLALGAFLAGLIVSESEYSLQALGAILPFRDAFSSLFFISIGMLLDLRLAAANPAIVVGLTLGVLLLKSSIATGVTLLLGYPPSVAVIAGLLLAQVGEFSFLLIHAAQGEGMLAGETGQLLVAGTVLTMALTPALASLGPKLSAWAARISPPPAPRAAGEPELSDHVIIVGYGLNGQNVARTLKALDMGYVILEVNPDTVRRLRGAGEPITYGSATQPAVLHHAGIERARVVVVTIPDAASARQVVGLARRLAPGVHIVVRTRFVGEMEELVRLGANEVVPEEFETSIELFSLVLRQYLVPRQQVEVLARQTRQAGYERLSAPALGHRPVLGLKRLLGDVEMEAYGVEAGSAVAGRTLSEAGIRRESGAIVLAVHRASETTPNPAGDFRLEVDDVALLLGTPAALGRAATLFRGAEPEEPGA